MSDVGRRDEQQTLGSDDVSVLVISGPGGVGKSTVAFELSLLLQSRKIGHALVDTDGLDHVYPVPPDLPILTERNLAAVWESYRQRGVSRLILTGVYLDRPDEVAWLERAIPGASFTFVRLGAHQTTIETRVASREGGSGQSVQVERSVQQLAAMASDRRTGVHALPTDDRSVAEIAGRVLALSGWAGEATIRRATPDDADAEDPAVGRVIARFPAAATDPLDVLALRLPDHLSRPDTKAALIALLAEEQLLSERYVGEPPAPITAPAECVDQACLLVARIRASVEP